MKKEYTSPRAEAIVLYTESMLASSTMQVDDENKITDKNNIGTQRKRGFGGPLWSSDEE